MVAHKNSSQNTLPLFYIQAVLLVYTYSIPGNIDGQAVWLQIGILVKLYLPVNHMSHACVPIVHKMLAYFYFGDSNINLQI